jgi:hypothetical protein
MCILVWYVYVKAGDQAKNETESLSVSQKLHRATEGAHISHCTQKTTTTTACLSVGWLAFLNLTIAENTDF